MYVCVSMCVRVRVCVRVCVCVCVCVCVVALPAFMSVDHMHAEIVETIEDRFPGTGFTESSKLLCECL